MILLPNSWNIVVMSREWERKKFPKQVCMVSYRKKGENRQTNYEGFLKNYLLFEFSFHLFADIQEDLYSNFLFYNNYFSIPFCTLSSFVYLLNTDLIIHLWNNDKKQNVMWQRLQIDNSGVIIWLTVFLC